eukprot:CAMPEP_0184672390 /NCGR_PEP_ID=MMETSP0308-20130426/86071_1 /TAXON_ID=38269 /ORGANISM="Gloeochaete witrockiana, Strain SAG 46.84" /LENGTH=139 /DNA_ID=CAMNT_0027119711 /DNA_START=1030 /DNA_END=1446 /DNA_ORIENTATION=+
MKRGPLTFALNRLEREVWNSECMARLSATRNQQSIEALYENEKPFDNEAMARPLSESSNRSNLRSGDDRMDETDERNTIFCFLMFQHITLASAVTHSRLHCRLHSSTMTGEPVEIQGKIFRPAGLYTYIEPSVHPTALK